MTSLELEVPLVIGMLVFYFAAQDLTRVVKDYMSGPEMAPYFSAIVRVIFWSALVWPAFGWVYKAAYNSGMATNLLYTNPILSRGDSVYFLVGLAILAGVSTAKGLNRFPKSAEVTAKPAVESTQASSA